MTSFEAKRLNHYSLYPTANLSLSRSDRILIWYSCGTKAELFELSRATAN